MKVNEMMKAIAANPAAVEMVDRMLANHNRELSFGEVIALVYNHFFKKQK